MVSICEPLLRLTSTGATRRAISRQQSALICRDKRPRRSGSNQSLEFAPAFGVRALERRFLFRTVDPHTGVQQEQTEPTEAGPRWSVAGNGISPAKLTPALYPSVSSVAFCPDCREPKAPVNRAQSKRFARFRELEAPWPDVLPLPRFPSTTARATDALCLQR